MGIQAGEVERIKEGSRLEDLVTRDVSSTEPSGDGFMCSSPFRRDRNPSFFVSVERQFWHDFGTHDSGDVVAYVRRRDGCGFVDALKTLCDTFGLPPLRFAKDDGFDPDEYSARQQIHEIACNYYEKVLWGKADARRAMRDTHGLDEDSLAEYRAGWADGLLHLHILDCYGKRFTIEQLLSSGLFYQRAKGLQDVFNKRGIFPYLKNGHPHFFIARRYDGLSIDTRRAPWEEAKYKKLLTHSTKYPYVMKGAPHPLFGLDTVRIVKDDDILVVTEGVTDAISAMEAGLKVISPVTVAFRKADYEPILRIAKRFKRVVIFNDLGDREDSGKKGAIKTAIYLHTNEIDVRLINAEALGIDEPTKGNKVDLNKFFVDHGATAVREAVDRAPKLPDFLIGEIPEPLKEDPQKLVRELESVFMLLKESDDITCDLLSQKVAKKFGIKKSVVDKQVKVARLEDEREQKKEEEAQQKGDPDPFEAADDEAVVEYPDAEIRGEVLTGRHCYYGFKKANDEMSDDGAYEDQDKNLQVISNFVFEPHERLVREDETEELNLMMRFEGKRLGPIAVPPVTWSSISRFREFFCRFGDNVFNGTSDNVYFLKGALSLNTEKVIYTREVIGFTEHDGERFFVWPGGVMDEDGVREDVSLRWHGSPTPLGNDLKLHEEDDHWDTEQLRDLAKKSLPMVLDMNQPEVVLTLLGWIYACPFSPQVKEQIGMFPLLWTWATAGAGKTTIASIISRLTGQSGTLKVCTMSPFALIKELSSSDCVPLFLDEYRDDINQRYRANLLEKARITANADSSLSKGTASQDLKIYRIGRPLFVGGETPPNDAATLERCLICNPSKKEVSLERQIIAEELDGLPLWRLASSYLRYAMKKNVGAQLEVAKAEMLTLEMSAGFKGRIPLRNRNALIVMLFGLNQFHNWASSLGVELELNMTPQVFAKIVNTCLGGEDEVLINDDGTASLPSPRTAVSVFLEEMHTMAMMGVIKHKEHYIVRDAESLLFFHFDSVYQMYLEHLRRGGREDEVRVGKKALRSAIREQSGEGELVVSNRKTCGGWVESAPTKVCVVVSMSEFAKQIKDEKFPTTGNYSAHHPDIPSGEDWGSN